MPFAELKATAVVANAPPTAMSQPVRGSARRRRLATRIAMPPTTAKPSSQPAWPPRLESSRRNGAGGPPKTPPAPRAAGARVEKGERAGVAAEDAARAAAATTRAPERLRPAGLAVDPAEAV